MISKVKRFWKSRRWCCVIFVLLLVIQCLLAVYFGSQKKGYFLDEIYTYELANSAQGRVGDMEDFLDTWQTGDFYHSVMTVDKNDGFTFSAPYENQVNDVHPFLYYFIVHAASSAFPEAEWKWIGITLNLIFSLFTSVFLFLLSRKILQSNWFALVSVAAWSWSIGAVDSTVFLRMYAMLMMWCTLFAFLQVCFLKKILREQTISRRTWPVFVLVTAGGILTQYYFLIYCFFLCLIVLLILLLKRKWKDAFLYVFSEGMGILLSLLLFPAMVDHIFNGDRGEEAFRNFSDSAGFGQNLRTIFSTISSELFNTWVLEIAVIAFILSVLVFLIRIYCPKLTVERGKLTIAVTPKRPQRYEVVLFGDKLGMIAILGCTCLAYIVMVCKVAPYQSDRYYFCIYPILSMIAVYLLFMIGNYILRRKKIIGVLSLAVVFLVTFFSYRQQDVKYLYTNYEQRAAILAEYTDYPVIVINLASFEGAPDTWMYEFETYDLVFRCTAGSFDGLKKAAEEQDLSKGFLIYAVYSDCSDEEFISEASQYLDITDWEVLTRIGCTVYSCNME